MKRIIAVLAVYALSIGAAGLPAFSQEPQYKMTTYQLIILKKGPAYPTIAGTPDGQKILQGHVQYLYAKGAEGTYKVAGPFTEDGEMAGIMFAAVPTPEKALEVEAEDPAVKVGVFAAEAISFMAPEGWFPAKWAPFGQFEQVVFGFLVTGPDQTHDQATAQRLQQEHLAYMAAQAKEGKLVAAGPITTKGARRGIVVYRVANLDEAKQRGSADPMVKAGRLAIELHQWQVPVGALPK